MSNPLEEYFRGNAEGPLVHKWLHYFDVYHRHFEAFRGRPMTLVEFGVSQGGSLAMWRDYFGPQARIFGVDADPRCAQFATDDIEVVLGDQEDRAFLAELREKVGPVDILIDDGGHTMKQQIATFEEMFPAVVDGGVYLVEDVHTSYWRDFGGGLRRRGTFIEYAKELIDQMHAWHFQNRRLQVGPLRRAPITGYTRQIKAMHVYDSVIVFEKSEVVQPTHEQIGRRAWEQDS